MKLADTLISVVILTQNEEFNLPGCLNSVAWSDDVVVFDSGSTDRTIELAAAAGARVIQHPFTDFSSQREASLRLGTFRHPWVLVLDADERAEPGLEIELRAKIDQDGPYDAFRLRRKDHFLGRWIPRATQYPVWFVRFLRHEAVHYGSRSVHEYPEVPPGRVGELNGHLLHYSFNKGLSDWIEKHNRYATLEAEEIVRQLDAKRPSLARCFSTDPVQRRRALKAVFQRLPARPLLRFLHLLLVKGSLLDGRAGIHYTLLMAFYEYLISIKSKELQRRRQGLPF